jgi:dethiobiotin synthetase
MIALGVTGTDTGVGKTLVSCALAAAFAAHGGRVGVFKPVETGRGPKDADRDGALLAVAARSRDNAELITPYLFAEGVAPLVAARRTLAPIDIGRLDAALQSISQNRDVVIVEGAGGLLTPISRDHAFDTLFARWRLGVLIVAANRLGAINHTRLTTQAAETAGLKVRAVVLNDADGAPRDASASSNEEALREMLPGIRVVRFPWMAPPYDHAGLADAAERSGLVAAAVA